MKPESSSQKHLTFARSKDGRFQISGPALIEMYRYVQDTPQKLESGGVLLGRHIEGSNDIIVDTVTVPLEGDQQGRFRFVRSRRQHQKIINDAWHESSATCTYLGEWHTHPEAAPTPSIIDRLNWQRKLMIDQFSEPIFFIIVGIVEIRVWEGYRYQRPVPIQQIEGRRPSYYE